MDNIFVDKRLVALRFMQAQQTYEQSSVLQKRMAERLFGLVQTHFPSPYNRVFEVGCGSGNLSRWFLQKAAPKEFILNDINPECLSLCEVHANSGLEFIAGDIEQLSWPNDVDLAVSNATVQWLNDFNGFLHEAYQSLKPNAGMGFSSFGVDNLSEIKLLTGRGLNYFTLKQINEMLQANGFEVLHLSEQKYRLEFPHPKAVLQHLSATGVTATAGGFRWTRATLAQFYQQYEALALRDSAQRPVYPLTYHPIYCVARKLI